MHQFRAAQPALLYLSPACILSVTFTALLRGELKAFWQFNDEDEEDKKAREEKERIAQEKEEHEKAAAKQSELKATTEVVAPVAIASSVESTSYQSELKQRLQQQ
jgi:minor histocompatibility antigen H13